MWLVLMGAALAASPLTWDNLNDAALSAWTDGPGAGELLRVEGMQRAARSTPLGPTTLVGEVQASRDPLQQQVQTSLALPLGLGIAERRAWSAEAELEQARAAQARWVWVGQVQEAWLDWWIASEIRAHLDAYAADVDGELDGFEVAVGEGLLSPLAYEDLQAESVQVHAEAAAMELQEVRAAARVRALLGDRPLEDGGHDLHEVPDPGRNPWTGLAAQVGAHPSVQVAAAEVEAARRRARALGAEGLPTLEAGPMWMPDASGELAPLAFVGLSVPLQSTARAERRMVRAQVDAASAEQAWAERSLAAWVEAEAAGWDAERVRMQRLEDEVLAPLARRQERLEQALEERLVTADRVVRARRETHEAEHELVLAAGSLLASEARARALRQLLDGGGA